MTRAATPREWLQPDTHEIGNLEAEACERQMDGKSVGSVVPIHPALVLIDVLLA